MSIYTTSLSMPSFRTARKYKFTLPVPQGYEMDTRFTLFSEALITSKETFNLVKGEYGAVDWGCDLMMRQIQKHSNET